MIGPEVMPAAKAGVTEGAKLGAKASVVTAAKAKGAWLPAAEYKAKMAATQGK